MQTVRRILLALLALTVPAAAQIPAGKATQTADLDGVTLQVFTYRPADCTVTGALLVFHGVARNAATYRDDAIPLASRLCLIVAAPLFDKTRFPTWRYQRGGVTMDGEILPVAQWTVSLVPRLAAWLRATRQQPTLPYVLLGHSGGAQFLARVVAYGRTEAAGVVIANPSTWVEPSLTVPVPYGFGKLEAAEPALQRYLAAPVTVLLGQDDTGAHNLVENKEAEAQGGNRLVRGQTTFRNARTVASQRGWPFGWRLSIVPGVGHDAAAMFASDQALQAVTAALAGRTP
jgi:poly(3-hydroxybutyrate) depolymerase